MKGFLHLYILDLLNQNCIDERAGIKSKAKDMNEKGDWYKPIASDCRQSPRFTPGLFYCSYQHFNDSSGFYQENSPTYQL